MVENIYRELSLRARPGVQFARGHPGGGARRRPADFLFRRRHHRRIPSDLRADRAAGKLFHPMADTMAFALVGALVLTLTLVPVLASYWFKNGVQEKRKSCRSNGCAMLYAARSTGAWIIRDRRSWHADHFWRASLLLIPLIGGEFLPHLDEGALWVRATMPYTISFEESGKFAPQIRRTYMIAIRRSPSSAPNSAAPMTEPIPPGSSTASFTLA